MKFDLHNHHDRCGHAEGTIEDYIQAAIREKLDVIGISDHSPFFASSEEHPYPRITMAKGEFPVYIEEIRQLKEKYINDIEVLIGVESDYFPNQEKPYRLQYDNYPMDYVIGSVHFVNGINIFDTSRWDGMDDADIRQVKEEYYRQIMLSAKSGMFDILGHIDALKGYFPYAAEIDTPKVDEALRVIGQEGTAIEINTSGKTKYCGGWYPSDDLLERALYYSVPVTFGSDAHVPERIGEDLEEVQKRLKQIGYRSWRFFRQRRPVDVYL
ncbi:phosphoesterase [Marinococcus halophilus]|uniref:Histidinol-phosphatase n=1 Tax=Marinococcus halophilus TaxID=1371 RepID=A0A510Y362_MARHA|nr:histidinol-phosphatase [Marinococcus halophilus]OZT81799.1 phosphoesterase [Marinococcus halophilus]GEK57762.1 histidinol-phosphatase [Marinococcus halophilus]